jgi:hypothetical protein
VRSACRRWIKYKRGSDQRVPSPTPTPEDVIACELEWILKCQEDSFGEELASLKEGRCVPKKSKLIKLSPFVDDKGVLRVNGRMD